MRVNLNGVQEEASEASSSTAEVPTLSMEGKDGHRHTTRGSRGTVESASSGTSRDLCTTSRDPQVFPTRHLSLP